MLQPERLNSLHAGIDWLDKTGLLKRNVSGNGNGTPLHDPVHDPHKLGKSAAGRFEARGASHLLVGFALGKGLMPAVITAPTWDVMKHHDAVARVKAAHAAAGRGDYAGGLVAKDTRRGMRSGSDFLQVGAADAASVNTNQKFAGADLWDWDVFQANVVDAAINRCPHARGHRALVN